MNSKDEEDDRGISNLKGKALERERCWGRQSNVSDR